MTSTAQKLEAKLEKFYGKKICIFSGNKRKGNILYGSLLPLKEAIRKLDIKGDELDELGSPFNGSFSFFF